jgi:hypothetical protein
MPKEICQPHPDFFLGVGIRYSPNISLKDGGKISSNVSEPERAILPAGLPAASAVFLGTLAVLKLGATCASICSRLWFPATLVSFKIKEVVCQSVIASP